MTFAELAAGGPNLADGAWGTEFQLRGLALGESPDIWNLTKPEAVLDVARAYVNAGSKVILTNTFRANEIALGTPGMSDKLAEINTAGATISKCAAAGKALVFASIGPTGKILMSGDVSEEDVYAAFAKQAEALAAGGADALLVETMSDVAEAAIALRAAKTTGLPVVVSFVFDTGKNKDRTMMGNTPEQVAQQMEELGAAGVGANCGVGADGYIPIATRLRAATKLPLWIKPNAGLPEIVDGKAVYQITPEDFATSLQRIASAGATFVGGCCGTSPAFIRAAAALLP